jgi:hypothetical protein
MMVGKAGVNRENRHDDSSQNDPEELKHPPPIRRFLLPMCSRVED